MVNYANRLQATRESGVFWAEGNDCEHPEKYQQVSRSDGSRGSSTYKAPNHANSLRRILIALAALMPAVGSVAAT
jgi:hypothetical protein